MDFLNHTFQTFYVSKEEINSPIITEIVNTANKIKENCILIKQSSILISVSFGKRIIINDINADFDHIQRNDFLEIVDYDPVKNVLLAIGQKEPNIDTPIHWMIHNARNDVNSIIQINNELLPDKSMKKITLIDYKNQYRILDKIIHILKALRDNKNIVIKNKSIIFIGNNLRETEKSVLKILGDKHEN